jgi:hypothetical protein
MHHQLASDVILPHPLDRLVILLDLDKPVAGALQFQNQPTQVFIVVMIAGADLRPDRREWFTPGCAMAVPPRDRKRRCL